MIYNYKNLKVLSDDMSILIILKFLGKLRNAKLKSGSIDDDCPPVLFWWFEKNNDEINNLIIEAVNNYDWQEEWVIENKGNNKWLLFPERIKDAERIFHGVADNENIDITDDGLGWLMENEPEFGRHATQDLDGFKRYLKKIVENYLKNKKAYYEESCRGTRL